MPNKMQNTDEWLDELFNMAINAKKVAVETVTSGDDADFTDRQEILDKSNDLLNRYRTEFKQAISERIAAERVEAVQEFAAGIQRKVDLEYKAGGRYPGHIIQPWEDVVRPLINKAALTPQASEGEKT
jgi:hypothetical protein